MEVEGGWIQHAPSPLVPHVPAKFHLKTGTFFLVDAPPHKKVSLAIQHAIAINRVSRLPYPLPAQLSGRRWGRGYELWMQTIP